MASVLTQSQLSFTPRIVESLLFCDDAGALSQADSGMLELDGALRFCGIHDNGTTVWHLPAGAAGISESSICLQLGGKALEKPIHLVVRELSDRPSYTCSGYDGRFPAEVERQGCVEPVGCIIGGKTVLVFDIDLLDEVREGISRAYKAMREKEDGDVSALNGAIRSPAASDPLASHGAQLVEILRPVLPRYENIIGVVAMVQDGESLVYVVTKSGPGQADAFLDEMDLKISDALPFPTGEIRRLDLTEANHREWLGKMRNGNKPRNVIVGVPDEYFPSAA